MVHSEVYLNKCVVSIAPFSTPACPDCAQNIQKTALFCMFSLFDFSSIFPGGQLTPFVPMCGHLWGQRVVGPGRVAAVERLVMSVFTYAEHIKTSNSVGGSLESSRPPDPTRLFRRDCFVASRRVGPNGVNRTLHAIVPICLSAVISACYQYASRAVVKVT